MLHRRPPQSDYGSSRLPDSLRLRLRFSVGTISTMLFFVCVIGVLVFVSSASWLPASGSAMRLVKIGVCDVGSGQVDRQSVEVPFVLRRIVIEEPQDGDSEIVAAAEQRMALIEDFPVSASLHAARLFGARYRVRNPVDRSMVPVIDTILDYGYSRVFYGTQPTFVSTRQGIRARTTYSRNARFQHERQSHEGQLLMALAEFGLSPDYPIVMTSSKHRIDELVDDAIANFQLGYPQPEWLIGGIVLYRPDQQEWTNKFGVKFLLDEVVDSLLDTPYESPRLSCLGTHLLYTLAIIEQVDAKNHILSQPTRNRVQDRLDSAATRLQDLLASGQPWLNDWHSPAPGVAREGMSPDEVEYTKVMLYGHHMEWLLIAAVGSPSRGRGLSDALDMMRSQLMQSDRQQMLDGYCPFTHVLYTFRESLGLAPRVM